MLHDLLGPQKSHVSLIAHLVLALLVSAGLLILAHFFLGRRGKRTAIMLVTFLFGLYFGLEYFLPVRVKTLWPTGLHNAEPSPANLLTPGIEPLSNILAIVGAFTVGLGVFSLIQVHGKTLLRRRRGWGNSLAFFISFIGMLVLTLWQFYLHLPESVPANLPLLPRLVNNSYEFLFSGLYISLQTATFSLLAFYIASAAYRAFRIRSVDAALMMLAAFIVMLAQVPVGRWLTRRIPETSVFSFFRLENLGDWVMNWWNSPAQRAIAFGVAIGALAMSLRIWLSLERGTFFSEGPAEEAGTAPSGTEEGAAG